MEGIIINGKHSYNDFGLYPKERKVEIPSKKTISQSVPFMNGSYDFSNLYGSVAFENREITYSFYIEGEDYACINVKKVQALSWAYQCSGTPLFDDTIPGYYFIATASDSSFEEHNGLGIITLKFTCYPFKISELDEGHDVWDMFNFELDYAQDVKFSVNNERDIKLYNASETSVTPTVVCSSAMEIEKNGVIYKFNTGNTKSWRFTLNKGDNILTIRGNGLIEFIWKKEVL